MSVRILLLLLVLPLCSHADDRPETATDNKGDKPGLVKRAVTIADDTQASASRGLQRFMTQVDGYFGPERAVENRSWARLRLDVERPAGESTELGGDLKLKLVLPNTEERLRLLISSGDDDSGDNDFGLDRGASSSSDASFALRFVQAAKRNGDVNLDLGVRQRDSVIQYFTRLDLSVENSSLEENQQRGEWWTRLSNRYTYYNKSGFENRLNLLLRRNYAWFDDLYFQSSSQLEWRHGRRGAVFSQVLGVYAQFSERKFLAFEGLSSYHTALNEGVSDRYRGSEVRLRWRHSVGRPWFFYEIWPSIAWPATTDYHQEYGLLLRAEVVIGSAY